MNKQRTGDEEESLYTVGFKLDSDSNHPDFYTILIYGNDDRAITLAEDILFFKEFDAIPKIIEMAGISSTDFNDFTNDVDLIVEIRQVFDIIRNDDVDESALVVDCLNVVFDLLKSIDAEYPIKYKEILFNLADHLTFDKNLSIFFEHTGEKRLNALHAFSWCIGVILSRSKVIRGHL